MLSFPCVTQNTIIAGVTFFPEAWYALIASHLKKKKKSCCIFANEMKYVSSNSFISQYKKRLVQCVLYRKTKQRDAQIECTLSLLSSGGQKTPFGSESILS